MLASRLARVRALYFLALSAVLVAIQLRAQILQLAAGYRPFAHHGTRATFSWDMFAVPIERCAVTWDPPLSIEGKTVAHWRDRGTYFEWDTAMSSVEGYQQEALDACEFRTEPLTMIDVSCINSHGERSEIKLPCP